MLKKLYQLPKIQQHIFSIVFSLLCMLAAMGFSTLYHNTHDQNLINVVLIFILFILIVSCNTVRYIYGVLCSLFAVLWFNYMYTYPYFQLNFFIEDYPFIFLFTATIAIVISTLTARLSEQILLSAEHERRLKEIENERMRANLLRAISHDLRTPLSGIIGNTSVYRDNIDSLTESKKRDIIDNIHEDATWLYNMVENVLTITRIHNEDMTIKTNIEFVEEVIGEVVQRMTKRHPECTLQVHTPDHLIMLPMDAILIEQVTINLLENAFMHSGSTEPVDLIIQDQPDSVSFTIRDYGQGIPADMLDSLFDGTSYTASHSADVKKGIGIGLVICKTIVDAHHGTISGRNHENGAEFTYTLPKLKEELS